MRRTIALLGTFAVFMCVAGGCATPRPNTIGSPEPGRELTDAEQTQIDQAEQILVQRCMAEHGFPYWVSAPLSADERREFGYVIDDVAWARNNGYGSRIRAKVFQLKENDPNLAYRKRLPKVKLARYTAVLSGGPGTPMLSVRIPSGGTIRSAIGGCEGKAQERLYGDRETWFRVENIASNLTPLYVPDLMRDARFIAALAAWSRCMRRAGHSYNSPEEIRAALPRLTQGSDSARAHAIEVRLAVSEATCARDSRLADTGRTLERQYRYGLRDRYGHELATHERLQHTALTRAREALRART